MSVSGTRDEDHQWFGTFESGGDCNAHLNAWFWCDEGSTYRLVLDGYFNDGYQTPVNCGADAGTTDCDCVVVTFEISCEGCCDGPLEVVVFEEGCYGAPG